MEIEAIKKTQTEEILSHMDGLFPGCSCYSRFWEGVNLNGPGVKDL